ncbi:MAG: type IV pilus twitching motility protein PilT [Lachnospiraceae bacterium]
MFDFETLLRMAVDQGASDIHLSTGVNPTARIDGILVPLTEDKMMPADIQTLAESIMSKTQKDILEQEGEVDFAHSQPSVGRFRINVFHQRGSYAVTARVLNFYIPTPEELHVPEAVIETCKLKRGLVLVTGATGSGKSTTLASLIGRINETRNAHILTLEDPIEYIHKHNKSIVNQREVGNDTKSFPNALRSALRQDPDVILVGEMRDLETISIAITAAETGHLVFSTLHTSGAANTIDRIVDVFPPYQQQQIRTQLADVVECIVSQQLIPTREGDGRVAAFEVMIGNSAIRNNIREGKTFHIQSAMLTNAKMGMKTMDDALLELYERAAITRDQALAFSQDSVALSKRLF